jgi:hypothetical protein
MPDQDWNFRMPLRWTLFNKFSYGGFEHDVTGVKTQENGYDAGRIAWSWQHTIVDFPLVFNVIGTLQYTPGDWQFTWAVVAVSPLSTEQEYRKWHLGPLGETTDPILAVYPRGQVYETYTDPGFDYVCQIIGEIVKYSDE